MHGEKQCSMVVKTMASGARLPGFKSSPYPSFLYDIYPPTKMSIIILNPPPGKATVLIFSTIGLFGLF